MESSIRRRRRSEALRKLKGKVVLVTGGSRGLGFAIARELALSGARLALTSRHLDELERARALLLVSGYTTPDDVWVYACDLTVQSAVREMMAAATAHFGGIYVLVNDAGIIMVGPLESQTLDGFHEAMNVNFFGALHATLAVLPQMLRRGDGAIVNIGSIGGNVAFPHLLRTWRATLLSQAGHRGCELSSPARGFASPRFARVSCVPARI